MLLIRAGQVGPRPLVDATCPAAGLQTRFEAARDRQIAMKVQLAFGQ